MKNVIFLNGTFARGGGIESFVNLCVKELMSLNVSVTIAVWSGAEKSYHYSKDIYQDLDKVKFDGDSLIYSNLQDFGVKTLLTGKLRGAKIIVHYHNTYEGQFSVLKSVHSFVFGFLVQLIADKIVCCSNDVLFKRVFRIFRRKAVFLPYPVEVVELEHNIKREENSWISVGRLVEQKNYQYAYQLLRSLSEKGLVSSYTLIGKGPDRYWIDEFQTLLGDRFTWIESTDNVSGYLVQKENFLFVSRWEGYGIALAEAQLLGLKCWTLRNSLGVREARDVTQDSFALTGDLEEDIGIIIQGLMLPVQQLSDEYVKRHSVSNFIELLKGESCL